MTAAIDDECVRIVRNVARESSDPAFAALHGRGCTARILDAVEGRIHPDVATGMAALLEEGRLAMDEVTAVLHRHHGAHAGFAAMLHALCAFRPGFGPAILDDEGMEIGRVGDHAGSSPRDAHWRASDRTLTTFQRVPDAVIAAMPGVRLARIVSHPALDPLDLVVEAAEWRMAALRIRVDGVRTLGRELLD